MNASLRAKYSLAIQIYAVVAGLCFFISALVYLYFGHWTVTHHDFWRIYEECLRRPWFEAALLKYNGHSHFFPSQLWLADLRFFHANMEVLFYIGLALLIFITATLLAVIWQDNALNAVTKTASSLAVVVANFWMGRAVTLVSGGFTCEYSLTFGGVIGALCGLWHLRDGHRAKARGWLVLTIFAATVSCFSFGTGLAVWPVLLVLGFRLHVDRRTYAAVAAVAILAYAVFALLPSRYEPHTPSLESSLWSSVTHAFGFFPELIGSPIIYIAGGWTGQDVPDDRFCFVSGIAGVVLVSLLLYGQYASRDAAPRNTEFIGLGLTLFGLFALGLVAIGRSDTMHAFPVETNAPRYLFWSTLLWLGVVLILLDRAQTHSMLRRVIWPVVFALPVLVFPSHFRHALHWRFARCLSEEAASALVNGVRDDVAVQALFRRPEVVYRLSETFRARRLDMFASGSIDWFGRHSTDVLTTSRKLRRCRAYGRIRETLTRDDGQTGAKLVGTMNKDGAHRFVVVDDNDVIRGLGVACALSRTIDQIFYANTFETNLLRGYIRDYAPTSHYRLRCVVRGAVSPAAVDVIMPSGE